MMARDLGVSTISFSLLKVMSREKSDAAAGTRDPMPARAKRTEVEVDSFMMMSAVQLMES